MGIVVLLLSLLMGGMFYADNEEFFNTISKQRAEGAKWHYIGKTPLAKPPVPSLPAQADGGEPFVLWKLKK